MERSTLKRVDNNDETLIKEFTSKTILSKLEGEMVFGVRKEVVKNTRRVKYFTFIADFVVKEVELGMKLELLVLKELDAGFKQVSVFPGVLLIFKHNVLDLLKTP